jgi:3-methylfumaryl-CoA hydratase
MTAATASALDLDHLRQWIGRTEAKTDTVTAQLVRALRATLFMDIGDPKPGDSAPFTAHWCLAQPVFPMSQLGPDGHPTRGGILPPVPLPRRMWAGGRLEFHHPLRVGEPITRVSRILDVSAKRGRSGALAFVTVRHEIANAEGTAIAEEHDIVYRDPPGPGEPAPASPAAPAGETFAREIVPDPVLLFRYSALTFNGHRIHYDRSYVTTVEGYPGLVVHGPLIATLLLDLLRRQVPQAPVRRFAFKAMSPLFDIDRFAVCGRPVGDRRYALWARNHEGRLAMQASAEIA